MLSTLISLLKPPQILVLDNNYLSRLAARAGIDSSARLMATDPGHHEIQQHEAGIKSLKLFKAFLTCTRRRQFKILLQRHAGDFPLRVVVVQDQNPFGWHDAVLLVYVLSRGVGQRAATTSSSRHADHSV